MNTHDIELPPLPTIDVMGKSKPQVWFTALEVDDLRRAAIEPYAKRIAQLEAARFAYASELPPDENGDPDVGSIHENIRKLKAELEADRKRRGEPVAWPEIELTPEQDEKYNSWVGSDNRKGFERMVARLAYKLNTSGRGLIDYDAAQHFATELRTIFALAASPQPAEPMRDALKEMQRFFGRWPEFVPSDEYISAASKAVQRMNAVLSNTPASTHAEPDKQHPDDVAVDAFAAAMKAKLKRAREEKGRGGWQDMSATELSAMLREHVEKGDPVDVANLAMMLHQNGQGITPAEPVKDGTPLGKALDGINSYFASKKADEPVSKTDWNSELSSWSDEDFIFIFHERPDLASRLRKILAEPVKTLVDNQEPLGEEFQRVLDEHSWDLYVKTTEPVNAPHATAYCQHPHCQTTGGCQGPCSKKQAEPVNIDVNDLAQEIRGGKCNR